MKVSLLASSTAGATSLQYATSFLINDSVAVDAGSLGFWKTPQSQAAVKHVFLSHTHIDHVATLPIFLDNIYQLSSNVVTIYGSREVEEALRNHVFNDVLWPDFFRLSEQQTPFLKWQMVEPGRPVSVAGLTITPLEMNHTVPTQGFVVEEKETTVVIAADTAPFPPFWESVERFDNLRGVFLEATFPNEMDALADVSKHLTPELFANEIRGLDSNVRVIAYHLKSSCHDEVARQVNALGLDHVEIAEPNREYEF